MRLAESIHWVACGYVGPYFTAANDSNVYVLRCPDGLVMVDAGGGEEPERIEQQMKWDGFGPEDIKAILLTHIHADHAQGCNYFREKSGCKIYCPEPGAAGLRKGGLYSEERPNSAPIDPCEPDFEIKDNEEFEICGQKFKAIWAPGHSDTMMCYSTVLDGVKSLINADSFYWGGKVTIFFYPDADRNVFRKTLVRLQEVEFDAILPGHRYPVMKGAKEHLGLAMEEIDRQLAGEPAMRG